MTKAKQKFDKTIARCEELIELYNTIEKKQLSNVKPRHDILRAAIVLAVAAFDAYATDCFSEQFVEYIKKHKVDESLQKLLIDAGFDVKFSLELINSDRPYRKIRTLIDRHYAKYTTQKLEVINQLFLQYRIKDITNNAAKKTGKNPDRIISSVKKLVERRHSIVHDGDYNEYCKIKPVSASDINRIHDLKLLVDNMDEIILNKMK